MGESLPRHRPARWHLVCGLAALGVVALNGRAAPSAAQSAFPSNAPGALLPIVRQEHYVVNARVRPFALFWISRDRVGDGRFIWREAGGDRRAFELLVGSDPARTPRQINRWGFIAEEVHGDRVDVLGFMKGSTEETIDAAAESVDQDRRPSSMSLFKAVRTSVTGQRAVSGAVSFKAPPSLTYRQLDDLLRMIPSAPAVEVTTIQLPAGARAGFLIAMTSMITESAGPCQRGRVTDVRPAVYLYKQALHDLTLQSCTFQRELRTKTGTYPAVVDARFEIRNRTTGGTQSLAIAYGTSGSLRDVPVRIVFRPRWWMEAELLLDRSGTDVP